MLTISISEQERAQLMAVLEEYLSELRMEIADTDRMEFRDMLKEKKRVLIGVLHALSCESGELAQAANQ